MVSKKIKAVVTDYIEEDLKWEAEALAKAGVEFESFQLKFQPEEEVAAKLADADVVVVNMVKMTASLLEKLPKCKLLIRHGIGYDNVDVPACTRLEIQFAYQPDYCMEDVAEHAIALIFALARKVPQSRKTLEKAAASGQWDFSQLLPFYRMDGRTVGIVGMGRIGSRVYRKIRHFGFKFLAHDPYLSEKRKAEFTDVKFVDKKTVFSESDYVTLHTPLNDETRRMVNLETLGWMKATSVLVNTARGPLVDAEALAEVLKKGGIAGAAIDVFDVEPPPLSHPLFGVESCILTPHVGWASFEAGWEIRKSIVNDILLFQAGKAARNVINKETIKT
ncbi:MAG: C-terminal binding protein [Phycisphaerales bacterium]|nr:C-terminal binding protein [Phycisphaerales bacterium]